MADNTGANPNTGISPAPSAVATSNVAYIPPGLEPWYKQPFSYNIIFNAIQPAAVLSASTQIQNDSYFVCVEQTADIWDSATGHTTNTQPDVAALRVRLLDTASGKYTMDQPTPIGAVFGTGKSPFVWLYRAQLYLPGGQLQAELTNNMAAAQQVILTFTGFKVYKTYDSLPNS